MRAIDILQESLWTPFWQQVFLHFLHLAFWHLLLAVHALHFFCLALSLKVAHSSSGGGGEGDAEARGSFHLDAGYLGSQRVGTDLAYL